MKIRSKQQARKVHESRFGRGREDLVLVSFRPFECWSGLPVILRYEKALILRLMYGISAVVQCSDSGISSS